MKVQAYLSFRGNCLEALNFYSELFDAEIVNRQTYEDKEMDVPSSYRNNLQHAELKGKNIHLMAYDVSPDTPLNNGNQIHMSVDVSNREEGEDLFKKLSNGGNVHHEYREREWGHFGRCTDKFGIGWMVNWNN
ncbi:VOC family protein [Winogradskyella ursingii]|uniref:VOC family protein n=1 Tax=Winogradskyella ursingii TaxID=2686079 RepID=UPI0015CCB4A1|nr:VOC family protein [Winogradskyella ursingii]